MRFMFAKFRDEIIKELLVNLYDENYGSCASASLTAKYNRIDLLEIILNETNQFNESTDLTNLASMYGYLDAIKFLSANGAKFESDLEDNCSAMELAAIYGHLDVLKWLHVNRSEGCSDGYALYRSAEKGYFEVVKYLIENELCGSDRGVLESAISEANRNDFPEIASYIRSVLDSRVNKIL